MQTPSISIQKLDPGCLPMFLRFFDGDAFSDNPKWASCYCQCFYEDHNVVKWSDRTAEQNRALACSYLVSENDNPVGGCDAAPRRLLHALDDEPTPNAETVGAIVCFLVSPSHRGKGVARALLDAACHGLREQGMTIAEANPRPDARTPADNHFGPLSLYVSSGFGIHRQDADGSLYVRRAL
jgi:GNAT superfamily N-acetyltransferase